MYFSTAKEDTTIRLVSALYVWLPSLNYDLHVLLSCKGDHQQLGQSNLFLKCSTLHDYA